MNIHVTVKPQGRWAEVTIHFETVDGPDRQVVYLPIDDAKEMERKMGKRITLHNF